MMPAVVCVGVVASTAVRAGGSVPSTRSAVARPYSAVTVLDDGPRRYTGERISLSLKDADIRDVIRVFAKLTGLNMVVDPEVRGSVTVELHDVPWDQAFELVLEVNGLGWERRGNVVVIARWATLDRRSRR
jgi:type IV pilus assembly protein PilQ